jgi:hypothetical protein
MGKKNRAQISCAFSTRIDWGKNNFGEKSNTTGFLAPYHLGNSNTYQTILNISRDTDKLKDI